MNNDTFSTVEAKQCIIILLNETRFLLLDRKQKRKSKSWPLPQIY